MMHFLQLLKKEFKIFHCDLLNELKNPQTRKLERDQDLLSFWSLKLNNQFTKGIAMVALDVLSTLCNYASVEREFSRAKNINN